MPNDKNNPDEWNKDSPVEDAPAADSEDKDEKLIPTGASIFWDIPGDIPGAARKSGRPHTSDEGGDPEPTLASSEPSMQPVSEPDRAERPSVPRAPAAASPDPDKRRWPPAVIALLLILALGAAGYGYLGTGTDETAHVASHAAVGPSATAGAGRDGVGSAGQPVEEGGQDPAPKVAVTEPPAIDPVQSNDARSASTVEAAASAAGQGAAPKPHFVTYVVKKGDTLWDIAEKYLNDPFRYPELAKSSHIRDPHWIYPGDIIRIPV